ncbi:MAG: molecular chaperone DnaJ [Candidatus Heimdallarchaeota archaeon]|nr:molecular chaperone DnaJ [Candidatus Heimdallarchaeota archaeon]
MPEKRDYYEVLDLSKDATDADIKKSFRKKAMQYHPDRNPDDPEAPNKFKEASEAYEILTDSEKRSAYDRFGFSGVESRFSNVNSGDFSSVMDIFNSIFQNDFTGDDFFSSIFGRRRARRPSGPQKGSDLLMNYGISFEDAIYGVTKIIDVPIKKPCSDCSGIGAEKGSSPETCSECRGAGAVMVSQRTAFGVFSTQQACRKCGGSGEIISNPCKKCRGTGDSGDDERIKLDIPPGVDTGFRLRVRGKGEKGHLAGPRGDLYFRLIVDSHPFYKRQNDNIIVELSIPYPIAVLGGDMIVPTPYGPEKVKIPKKTKEGNVLRLSRKGIQRKTQYGMNYGDFLIIVHYAIPSKLSENEKELLTQLKDEMPLPKKQEKLFQKLIEDSKKNKVKH